MTLLSTSSVSSVPGAGTQSGPVFSPAVLNGDSRPKAALAKPDSAGSGAVASPLVKVASSTTAVPKSASTRVADLAKNPSASAVAASSEAAKAAAEKAAEARAPAKSANVGEDGEILLLKSQGENLSEIAVDLSISVAAVNGDLQTDIPKFSTPAPVVDSSAHSTISVFA